jgi:hypothetical protein
MLRTGTASSNKMIQKRVVAGETPPYSLHIQGGVIPALPVPDP